MENSKEVFNKYDITIDELDYIVNEVRKKHNVLVAITTIRLTYNTSRKESVILFKEWIKYDKAKQQLKESIS